MQSSLHVNAGLHVAMIMDGNGRWARRRGLPRAAGHRAGVTAVRRVIEAAPALGIRMITLFAFSCDNWRRPAGRVLAKVAPTLAWFPYWDRPGRGVVATAPAAVRQLVLQAAKALVASSPESTETRGIGSSLITTTRRPRRS